MYRVYSDEEFRDEIVKRGLKKAEMFSWERAVNETIRVFYN
jgi:glycosyltransferase involved in cell wall biosynthesis